MRYWKGAYKGGSLSRLFCFLLLHPGRTFRISEVIDELYGDRIDGPPTPSHFRVLLTRIRRSIRDYGIPVRIDTESAPRFGDAYGGSITLFFEGGLSPPERP